MQGDTEYNTIDQLYRSVIDIYDVSFLLFPVSLYSGLGSWYGFISYEACVRLCLHAWARECTEAPFFLDNECAVLRDAFG